LKIYRPSTPVGKYYAILFSLPHRNVILGITILFVIITVLSMGFNSIPYIIYFLSIVFTLLIYTRITNSMLYKLKRILGLSLFSSIYALIIGLFTKWDIGVLGSTTILTVVLLGLDGTKIYRYLFSLLPAWITLIITYPFNSFFIQKLYLYLASSLLIVLADYIIYLFLGRYRFRDHKAPDLGTLFLWNWLERRRDLEKVFENMGCETIVKPRILINDHVAIIYTDVHYGPFSNIGSSMLPMKLDQLFAEKFNRIPLILHGMGSHERNIVSSREADRFTEYIASLISNEEAYTQKYYGAFKLVGSDQWEVLSLVFTDISLLFISRPGSGIDDLPYDLQRIYEEKALARGIGDIILIDAHNWEKEKDFNIEALKDLLDRALAEIEELKNNRDPVDVMVRSTIVYSNALGVIGNRVYGLEIKGVDGRGHVLLVYFRGNNIAPGVRDEIRELISRRYGKLEYIEVLTNDEHTETGVRAFVTYIPIQETGELKEAIINLIDRIKESNWYKKLYLIGDTEEFKLMDNDIDKLVRLLEKVYPLTTILLSSYVLVTPVILAYLLL